MYFHATLITAEVYLYISTTILTSTYLTSICRMTANANYLVSVSTIISR